jgi:hypothetical protein
MLVHMFGRARIPVTGEGTQADRAYAFGMQLARAALGTQESGSNLQEIRVPSFQVTLDDDGDAISWDGGLSWPTRDDQAKNPSQWPSSSVQSLLFDKHRYTERAAKQWAKDHGLRYGSVDTTEHYHRLRQFEPQYGQPCRTIEFGHGIKAVICAAANPAGETLWAVMVNGRRFWEIGHTPEAALGNARQRYGPSAKVALETGPGGDPIRTVGNPLPGPDAGPDTASEMPLQQFAETVNAELPYIQTEPGPEGMPRGRFGDRKVFIAALWRQLRTHPRMKGISEAQFKARLLEAQRLRLVRLARADLVAAMDHDEVVSSEVDAGGARFHFVIDQSVG